MKFFLAPLFLTILSLVVLTGCERSRFEMGNVPAPKGNEAPAYSVSPDKSPSTQTR